ncbi:glycosyltransferase family 2 protein [Roseomonas sp. USHLN139]|uniref:glycosyltransferase family 2 protein n=1 Tax=Roseomonas sp. USHLN139 TaxID=3081298 RepID=UPI003B01CF4C
MKPGAEILRHEPAAPPELTVLMPVYMSESMVAEAIASVLAQQGCVMEVIISDDASTDGTLQRAIEACRDYRGPHALRLLASQERAGIDHLGRLIGLARCDFLVEAHGDDVSLPGRMARLLALHREQGAALIVSAVEVRDGATETVTPEAPVEGFRTGWLAVDRCIPPQGNGVLVGARYAFHRMIHDAFAPLDSRFIPSSHDRVQAFRAALLGKLWLTEEPLLQYRRHDRQGSKALADLQNRSTRSFGWSLRHLSALRAMQKDTRHAGQRGLIPPEEVERVTALLQAGSATFLSQLLDSRDALVRARQQAMWVSEDALRENNTRPPRP